MQNDELRSTEERLTAMRDRYRSLYDHAPIGYLTLDDTGRVEEANERARAMLATESSSVVGTALAKLLTADDADSLHRHLGRARSEGFDDGCELTLFNAGHGPLPVHVTSRAATGDLGQPSGFLTILFDLTELRHAEDSLKVLEARNDVMFDGARESILRCDGAGLIEAVNAAAANLFGYAPEDLVGRHLGDVVPGSEATWSSESGSESVPLFGKRSDGETFPIEVRIGQWEEGRQHKLMVFILDITEKTAREEELRQAHKMEAMGTLASGVAHDFNNVLQAVLGCLTIAKAEDTPIEQARDLMDRAAFAVQHGGELARGLLAFARRRKVELRELHLDRFIRATAPLIERLVGEHVTVTVSTRAPKLRILADSIQLEQILMNLAANARDAMPAGGALTIRTEVVNEPTRRKRGPSQRPRVRLVIEDTGEGMDAATQTRMFEPFFTTKGAGRGTGLGLSTVFSVTKDLGGIVDVESEVGVGTRFSFTFPTVAGSHRPTASSSPPRVLEGAVLLVEDEPLIRMSTRHHLERLGLVVVEAENGDEALEAFASAPQPIDVLVSDIVLPATMGTALAETLRHRQPDLPIVFITANPELTEQELPADALVLQKPFGLDDLGCAVQQALAPRSGPSANVPPAPALPRIEETAPVRARPRAELTILIVEDDVLSGPVLAQLLEQHGYSTVLAVTMEQALASLDAHRVSLVISDLRLPDGSGEDLVGELRKKMGAAVPALFMSGADRGPPGAAFLQKPVDFEEVVRVVDDMLGVAPA